MEIPATPENRVLASSVNSRIRSDARRHNAQAALYRLAGIGLLVGFAGIGVGAACYGYASLHPPVPAADMAAVVADAISRVTFKTEGTVKLDPDAQIALASRSDMPTPSAAQLGAGAAPESKAAVNTNFTVFKNVPFGRGQVVTGWNFDSGAQKSPSHQYCYYSEQIDDTSKVTVDLGLNGAPSPPSKTRASVDAKTAYPNCVWFRNGAI